MSAEQIGDYFRIPPDLRDLRYEKFVEQGEEEITGSVDYNSHNTRRLTIEEMKAVLLELDYIKSVLSLRTNN